MIPALNRDGDVLSDLVLPLFGSIAGAESLLVAFDDDYVPDAVMAEAAHGTAPALQGKNVANPMAMILAAASLLGYGTEEAQQAGRAIREGCLEAVADGVRTADLGGHTATDEFTDDVIRRAKQKLEVWAWAHTVPGGVPEDGAQSARIEGTPSLPPPALPSPPLRPAVSHPPPAPRISLSSPSAHAARKARTTAGSNWVPAPSSSWARAPATESGGRYGRAEIIASNASATATILAPIGICSRERPVGYPRPSHRSWWKRM